MRPSLLSREGAFRHSNFHASSHRQKGRKRISGGGNRPPRHFCAPVDRALERFAGGIFSIWAVLSPVRCFVLGAALQLMSGCVVPAVAQAPQPLELPPPRTSGKYRLAVLRVSDEELCSSHSRLREFCVTRLRSALSEGLDNVLGRLIDGKRPGGVYRAAFRLLALSHDYTPEADDDDDVLDDQQDYSFAAEQRASVSVRLTMRWSFELRDSRGRIIVQLAESTDGPMELLRLEDADAAVRALLKAVVHRVASGLNAASWPKTPASE